MRMNFGVRYQTANLRNSLNERVFNLARILRAAMPRIDPGLSILCLLLLAGSLPSIAAPMSTLSSTSGPSVDPEESIGTAFADETFGVRPQVGFVLFQVNPSVADSGDDLWARPLVGIMARAEIISPIQLQGIGIYGAIGALFSPVQGGEVRAVDSVATRLNPKNLVAFPLEGQVLWAPDEAWAPVRFGPHIGVTGLYSTRSDALALTRTESTATYFGLYPSVGFDFEVILGSHWLLGARQDFLWTATGSFSSSTLMAAYRF